MNRRCVRLACLVCLTGCLLLSVFAGSAAADKPMSYQELHDKYSRILQGGLEMGGYVQWQNADSNRLKVRFKVTNKSETQTVKAFEIYVYAEDVWGETLYGDTVYYATTKKKVLPGETAYSDYIVIPQRKSIGTIRAGIHRVLYDDGSVDEFEGSSLSYWRFEYTP